MYLDEAVIGFTPPKHPFNISLEGVHTILEPLSVQAHSEDLFIANSLDIAQENWAYLPYGPFENITAYQAWLSSMVGLDDPVFFAVIDKKTQKALGITSFLRINPNDGSIEVGHIHFSPLLQRTLMASEAMFLMMQWVFEQGYRRYEWKCNALNVKSRNAALRFGFSYEGIFRQMSISKGKNRDTAWFAMIDKEWPAIKTCFTQYLAPNNYNNAGTPIISLSSLTKPLLHQI